MFSQIAFGTAPRYSEGRRKKPHPNHEGNIPGENTCCKMADQDAQITFCQLFRNRGKICQNFTFLFQTNQYQRDSIKVETNYREGFKK